MSAARPRRTANCGPARYRPARAGRAGAPLPAPGFRSPRTPEVIPGRESRLAERQGVGAVLEAESVLGADNPVGREPMLVVLDRKIAPHEGAAAFLALERGKNDQLADVDHVDGVDGVEPFVIGDALGTREAHARQQIETDGRNLLQRRLQARGVLLDADLVPPHRADRIL